jgi:hypothetical protein
MKKGKSKVCKISSKCLTWKQIYKNFSELITDAEKIDYLKKVVNNSEFLRKNVRKKVFNTLGEVYIKNGLEKEAGKAFTKAENKELAKECYQTSNFFNEKDERLLKQKKDELRRLKNEKSS